MNATDYVSLTPQGASSLELAYARENVIAAVREGDRTQAPLRISTAFAAYNRAVIRAHDSGRL